MIAQIELRWGDDLRVDPLTRDLAVVGSSYHESRVDPGGKRTEENGYFTGVVQYGGAVGISGCALVGGGGDTIDRMAV